MKIYIKGGQWSNVEDEVLKAGVSKYGLSNWARVAALIERKTADQCKARWNEWLNPTIKKTEWSKEEEQRLMQLARAFPGQWRVICTQMEGRTAGQCLEQFEALMDRAERAAQREEGSDAKGPGTTGEIDYSWESKPAKPDAVHRDEYEEQTLDTALARLANTKRKKGLARERQRQQEETHLLAGLQKRREQGEFGLAVKLDKKERKIVRKNAAIVGEGAEQQQRDEAQSDDEDEGEERQGEEKGSALVRPVSLQSVASSKPRSALVAASTAPQRVQQQSSKRPREEDSEANGEESRSDFVMSRAKLELPQPVSATESSSAAEGAVTVNFASLPAPTQHHIALDIQEEHPKVEPLGAGTTAATEGKGASPRGADTQRYVSTSSKRGLPVPSVEKINEWGSAAKSLADKLVREEVVRLVRLDTDPQMHFISSQEVPQDWLDEAKALIDSEVVASGEAASRPGEVAFYSPLSALVDYLRPEQRTQGASSETGAQSKGVLRACQLTSAELKVCRASTDELAKGAAIEAAVQGHSKIVDLVARIRTCANDIQRLQLQASVYQKIREMEEPICKARCHKQNTSKRSFRRIR